MSAVSAVAHLAGSVQLAASTPTFQPPTRTPGLIFTALLCLIFIVWGVAVGVIAYRARARKDRLHGGAWAVTGPWTPPQQRFAPPPRFGAPPHFGPPPQYGPPPQPGRIGP